LSPLMNLDNLIVGRSSGRVTVCVAPERSAKLEMNEKVGSPFDAALFAQPLAGQAGLVWESPREIHKVVVRFAGAPPMDLALQYWRTKWPQQRLPKQAICGGGSVGWWELGNWFTGEWQTADVELSIEEHCASFLFRPLTESEFPDLDDFPAAFRTTLKIRLRCAGKLPEIEQIEALTDSTWDHQTVTVLWEVAPAGEPSFEAFNGDVEAARKIAPGKYVLQVWRAKNADPNSFDKTLLTIKADDTVTVLLDDLADGPVCVPDFGLCVAPGEEQRDFARVNAQVSVDSQPEVYDMVAQLPEQTWARAWANMVPKKERFYLPLAVDGGRHKFRLNPDGSVLYRTNNHLLVNCPGRDTPRLESDKENITVSFGRPTEPEERTIQDGVLPVGITSWECGDICVRQVAFATILEGTDPQGPPPPGDALGVFMAKFNFQNPSDRRAEARLPIRFSAGEAGEKLRLEGEGLIWAGDKLRAVVDVQGQGELCCEDGAVVYISSLGAEASHSIFVKIPYVALQGNEVDELKQLDFEVERDAVASYWRRRLTEGMKLTTPETMLNEFHRAHAGHLLINCEREPDCERRFARVGSFGYAAYGNESCMMTVDLDRRGYHREARQCLEAFVRYQGTVPLPGDFSSHDGVLYGACGYEQGGYNQHHGWILWALVEHYKFTRDDDWLTRIAPNVVAGANWIIRERNRMRNSDDIGRGLLPFGSLEDIGDWWQWLSTNAYTWRGLDAAAWGLAEIGHPEADCIRREADDYRASILRCFEFAAQRSPAVRLRNGTFVPHYPSHPHRRGRSFGWICETLEGAIHLLITGLISPHAPEARWIIDDYEDNLYLSEDYGYRVEDFERHWFDWGGFSMQACLLLNPEPYLYRDDVKHALRGIFNAIAAQLFPDTRMLTEHALPELGDWRGDHYKTSDEANAAGWLRYLFVREEGEELLLGQAVPREWLQPGQEVGVANAATYFGPTSLTYAASDGEITAHLHGPRRNPPAQIKLRFRAPQSREIVAFYVNGELWADCEWDWVILPGDVGDVQVRAELNERK